MIVQLKKVFLKKVKFKIKNTLIVVKFEDLKTGTPKFYECPLALLKLQYS